MDNIVNNENLQQQQAGEVKLKDLLALCLSHWKWFVLSGVVCLGIAIYYLSGQAPVYSRSSSILVKEQGSKGSGLFASEMDNFASMGMFSAKTNVYNEQIAIQSPDLILQVVRRLNLDMNYYAKLPRRRYKQTLYGSTLPVKVELKDLSYNQGCSFKLILDADSTFTLKDFKLGKDKFDESVQVRAGEEALTPVGNLVVNYSPFYNPEKQEGNEIYVTRTGLLGAISRCKSQMTADLNGKMSTVIDIGYKDYNIQRAEDFLNTLISSYNENWVKDKNRIAVSTSEFIDERLQVIERELGDVDKDISTYKSTNLIPDVKNASQIAMQQATQANVRITELNNELYMARYVRDQVTAQGGQYQLLPANSGITDSGVGTLINDYNGKVLQRNSLVANSSPENPLVKDLDRDLTDLQGVIVKSIDNAISKINSQIQSQRSVEGASTSRLASNPKQAEYLLSVERQQQVKQSLYLFLLQKREENELSQAFTAYNTRTIISPIGGMSPVAPHKMRILLIALMLALAIPIGIIYLVEVLNSKVRGRKDIEKLTMPFIGEIPQNTVRPKTFWEKMLPFKVFQRQNAAESNKILVKPRSRNVMNEAFRVVRTNIELMESTNGGAKVIMCTSVNPGSGKTFLSMNIATSFAIKGKKVIALDLDLRRASLSAYVGSPKTGVSDYLNGRLDDWKGIVTPVEGYETLSVIPVGTIPPNPAELLYSPRLQPLLDALSAQYDMIFLDCPPVEIVADSSIIAKYANLTIFVVRAGLMEREMLPTIEQYYKEKRFSNMCLLLNGTMAASGHYGYHRYGYHYGYSYGYGHYGSYGGYSKEDE